MNPTRPRRLAVLVSGGGRTLENFAESIERGELNAQIALVLSDRPGVFALERAKRLGIPAVVVPYSEHGNPESFSRAAFAQIEQADCDVVALSGFLRLLLLPDTWIGRVLNIHPALLPAYGGKGYYGDRVHRAVLENAEARTGCTVHYVTNEYDTGPIILQREVDVLPGDTVDALGSRVFEAEKLAYPEALRRHLNGETAFRAPSAETPVPPNETASEA